MRVQVAQLLLKWKTMIDSADLIWVTRLCTVCSVTRFYWYLMVPWYSLVPWYLMVPWYLTVVLDGAC